MRVSSYLTPLSNHPIPPFIMGQVDRKWGISVVKYRCVAAQNLRAYREKSRNHLANPPVCHYKYVFIILDSQSCCLAWSVRIKYICILDRTGGAVCNVSYWHVGVQYGFDGHQASKLCAYSGVGIAVYFLSKSGAEEACQIYDPTTKLIFPQDITLGLLWPKFTHRYCVQKEIIKIYKGKCLSINKIKKYIYILITVPAFTF